MTTALVTGATTGGIGYYIALGLATAGHDVVIVGRDPAKVRTTQEEITRLAGHPVATELADLATLAEVEHLAERVKATYPDLTLLVNNAGLFAMKKQITTDGTELDMAVNHIAPFLLTWRLLPLLARNGGARVVTVNSDSHERVKLTEADLAPTATFNVQSTYGKSKLANMATIVEMARRVPVEQVTINGVHPGAVGSNIGNLGGLITLGWSVAKRFLLTPEKGADTPLWAATAPELATVTGQYFKKRAVAPTNPLVQDAAFRAMVWERTLALAHLSAQAVLLG